jgi:hypothetical protein
VDNTENTEGAWLQTAINRAKQSALPILLREFGLGDPDDPDDADALCDAVELALLAVTGAVTEAKLREALRPIAEMYAQTIDAKWESVADAILGTLEWLPPDKKNHVLDPWGGVR